MIEAFVMKPKEKRLVETNGTRAIIIFMETILARQNNELWMS